MTRSGVLAARPSSPSFGAVGATASSDRNDRTSGDKHTE
jgi:hypothetical protein